MHLPQPATPASPARVSDLAIPEVSVHHDALDYWSFGVGAVGIVIAIIALIVAGRARKDIVKDRREVFELGVLKEIAEEGAPSSLSSNFTSVGMNTSQRGHGVEPGETQ